MDDVPVAGNARHRDSHRSHLPFLAQPMAAANRWPLEAGPTLEAYASRRHRICSRPSRCRPPGPPSSCRRPDPAGPSTHPTLAVPSGRRLAAGRARRARGGRTWCTGITGRAASQVSRRDPQHRSRVADLAADHTGHLPPGPVHRVNREAREFDSTRIEVDPALAVLAVTARLADHRSPRSSRSTTPVCALPACSSRPDANGAATPWIRADIVYFAGVLFALYSQHELNQIWARCRRGRGRGSAARGVRQPARRLPVVQS